MSNFPKQLIIIGDSGIYGWGDTEGGGWSERLRKNWMNIDGAPIIYSLGIRGDGLEKVASRWRREWECRGELRRKVPDAILFSIGLNDTARIGGPNGRPQLSSEAFGFGLKQLINEAKNETTVMLMGITPVNEKAMPFAKCLWYSNEMCSIYEKKIEDTCLELDIPFLAIHKKMLQEFSNINFIGKDGIHLNKKGHKWIYNEITQWNILKEWSSTN